MGLRRAGSWRWLVVLAALFFLVAYAVGGVLRGQWPTPGPARPVAGVTAEAGPDQVHVTVGSSDVPGCHGAGEPFRVGVESRWGELVAHNTVTFYWRRGPDEDGLTVRVEGQSKESRLRPGETFPVVTLRLPLGERSTEIGITTFTFDRWGDGGQACFGWAQTPGTPRPQRVRPGRGEEA